MASEHKEGVPRHQSIQYIKEQNKKTGIIIFEITPLVISELRAWQAESCSCSPVDGRNTAAAAAAAVVVVAMLHGAPGTERG